MGSSRSVNVLMIRIVSRRIAHRTIKVALPFGARLYNQNRVSPGVGRGVLDVFAIPSFVRMARVRRAGVDSAHADSIQRRECARWIVLRIGTW